MRCSFELKCVKKKTNIFYIIMKTAGIPVYNSPFLIFSAAINTSLPAGVFHQALINH